MCRPVIELVICSKNKQILLSAYRIILQQGCYCSMKHLVRLAFGFVGISNKYLKLDARNSVWMYIIHYILILYEIIYVMCDRFNTNRICDL